MMDNIDIVGGLGYGDEGKGLTVSFLSQQRSNPLVIRYGGGNQVGHTVMVNGQLFEHHHTGAGTLNGVPTFYTKMCTVDPFGVLNELDTLEGIIDSAPRIFYDPRCMIVTPFDVLYNHEQEEINAHGSVGVGFGATVARNDAFHRLNVMDIHNRDLFLFKYEQIRKYYSGLTNTGGVCTGEEFFKVCKEFYSRTKVTFITNLLRDSYYNFKSLIFEGHQGALLDMEYGAFPHVTRSKTTAKYAIDFINEYRQLIGEPRINFFGITRAYHTRHGNGPFVEGEIQLKNNQWETNSINKYQGRFKVAPFKMPLFKAGMHYNILDMEPIIDRVNMHVVLTCCDQIDDYEKILERIKTETRAKVLTSMGPSGEGLKLD